MGKRKQGRNRGDNDGMVYSTNPGYSWEDKDQDEEDWSVGQCATLYVSLDRKQRAGKPVTLVEGFDGPATELASVGQGAQAAMWGGRCRERRLHLGARRPPRQGGGPFEFPGIPDQTQRRMNLYLKTLAGLEALAAEELKAAGATHIEVGRRGISF